MANVSEKVLNDSQAVSLAEALATANEAARQAGVFHRAVRLQIEEEPTGDGIPLWRIHYLPVPPPGIFLRGGDYTVEIDARDGAIHRVLQGQ